MAELGPAGELYRSGDFMTGLQSVRELWSRVPEPKTGVLNAYMVLEYAVAFALKLGHVDEAWRWACLAPAFSAVRQDRGEVEFLLGRVAFERGDIATAKEQFQVAHRKSQGRLFQDGDARYQAIVSGRHERTTDQ